jgi:hypothetical protein
MILLVRSEDHSFLIRFSFVGQTRWRYQSGSTKLLAMLPEIE